jgi:F-type H+-transporting ATPase subunit gamma
MPTLRDIKQRITGVQKTQTITRALKMVAAVKLRRAQQSIVQARPYARRLNDLMGHIASKIDRHLHPLLAVREPKRVCYVIVTSDQGLCGSFNQNIIRKAESEIKQNPDQEIDFIFIGKKGRDHFVKRNYKAIGEYVSFFRNLQFEQAVDIATLIRDLYIQAKLDRVFLIYNEFKSAVQQQVIVEQLLPIIPIIPEDKATMPEFIFEPDPILILDTLCPKNLNVQIWRVLLESYASEMGARMTAMEYATENANKLIGEMQMQYNKKRQEGITEEILEIISGSEALKI